MKTLSLIFIFIAFHLSALAQDKAHYKIQSEKCGDDNKCFVFAFIEPERYDEANMQRLAEDLAAKYKDRAVVNFNVFDDEKLTEAFLNGKRSPSEVQVDRRAYFLHIAECGDLLFYKPKKNKIKVIRLKWENTERCNKPITI